LAAKGSRPIAGLAARNDRRALAEDTVPVYVNIASRRRSPFTSSEAEGAEIGEVAIGQQRQRMQSRRPRHRYDSRAAARPLRKVRKMPRKGGNPDPHLVHGAFPMGQDKRIIVRHTCAAPVREASRRRNRQQRRAVLSRATSGERFQPGRCGCQKARPLPIDVPWRRSSEGKRNARAGEQRNATRKVRK